MRYYNRQVVFQEVPNEISLAYSITGCKIRCEGCHSPFTWSENTGNELTEDQFIQDLEKYGSLISCVLFYGGEWSEQQLIRLLSIARNTYNLKTCLYTGQSSVPDSILSHLTFVKTGKWDKNLGGLQSPTTNQVFLSVQTGTIMNNYFLQN
jgi:anaerobic ribonucleoside-triphosphate reductase activating protein